MLQKGQIQAPTLSRDGFDPTSVYRTEHHWRLRQSAPKFIVRLRGRHCSAEHYVRPCKLPYRGSLVVQRGSVFATTRRVRGIRPGMAGAQVGIYEGGAGCRSPRDWGCCRSWLRSAHAGLWVVGSWACSLATCSKTVRFLTMVLGSSRVSRETARSPHACRCHDMKWKAWFPRVNSQCTRVLRALLVPWLRQWRRPASSTKASFEGIVSPPFLSFVEVEWKHSAGTPDRRAAIPDLGDRSHSL